MARIKDEAILKERAIKMLPKGIPAEAIEDVECDPIDGGPDMEQPSYWIYLADGYLCEWTDCQTIHEDSLKEIKLALSTVVAVDKE